MATFIATECFDRLVAEGSTSDVRTMKGHIRSGAPGSGAGKPNLGTLLAEVGQLWGKKVVTFLAKNVVRSNRCGVRTLVVTLTCTIGGMYPLSPIS